MIIRVDASKSYDIHVEKNVRFKLGQFLQEMFPGKKIAIVSDNIVSNLYFREIKEQFIFSGHEVIKFVIPYGESSKNGKNYLKLVNYLAENQLTRSDVILALGGGVVGDLAGFAAATYLRGTHFIQIPTSLLAMVDSSVGGKTAIDLKQGKNLAGAFYQPDLVLCDHDMLKTLPESVFTDGMAEVIKYGIISDKELFEELKKGVNEGNIEKIIGRCIEIKRDVVNEDEKDLGIRQILNFGHTIGHAVEKCSEFTVSHGKAVAIGMAIVARASAKRGFCSNKTAKEILSMLEQYGLPVSCEYSASELYSGALSDKKRSGDSINLIIPREIGSVDIVKTPVSDILSFIEDGLS